MITMYWGKSGMKVISLKITTIIQAMDDDNLVAAIKVVRILFLIQSKYFKAPGRG